MYTKQQIGNAARGINAASRGGKAERRVVELVADHWGRGLVLTNVGMSASEGNSQCKK